VMAPLSYSSGRPMSVAERLGPGARRLGRGGAAQRRLTRIVNQLRLVAKVRRQLTVLIIAHHWQLCVVRKSIIRVVLSP